MIRASALPAFNSTHKIGLAQAVMQSVMHIVHRNTIPSHSLCLMPCAHHRRPFIMQVTASAFYAEAPISATAVINLQQRRADFRIQFLL
jgi:hypothetical protein